MSNQRKAYEMLGLCSFIILIVSGCAAVIGFVSIVLFIDEGQMPYALGAPLFAAVFAAGAAISGIVAYRKGLAVEAENEKSQQASHGATCWIIASFSMCTTNVTFLFLLTSVGVVGLVLCDHDYGLLVRVYFDEDEHFTKNYDYGVCREDHDAKIVMSALTLVFGLALWILNFCLLVCHCHLGQILGLSGRSRDSRINKPMPPNATAMQIR